MRARVVLAVLMLGLGLTTGSCGKGSLVKFAAYEQSAVESAHASGKPVLIYGTADW